MIQEFLNVSSEPLRLYTVRKFYGLRVDISVKNLRNSVNFYRKSVKLNRSLVNRRSENYTDIFFTEISTPNSMKIS